MYETKLDGNGRRIDRHKARLAGERLFAEYDTVPGGDKATKLDLDIGPDGRRLRRFFVVAGRLEGKVYMQQHRMGPLVCVYVCVCRHQKSLYGLKLCTWMT